MGMECKGVCLSFDPETKKILEEFKWTMRHTKSEIVRKIIKHFNTNQEQLKEILESD